MTLKDCTKDELIFIINRMCWLDGEKDWHLQRALNDLSYKREQAKLDEAKELADYAAEKSRLYQEIMGPYDGVRITEIPSPVLKRAQAALKAADEANEKWMKLMDIKPKGRKQDAATKQTRRANRR